jgi:hypothetical protein
MTLITLQDGKLVLRDGKVGAGEACCCGDGPGCGCCENDYLAERESDATPGNNILKDKIITVMASPSAGGTTAAAWLSQKGASLKQDAPVRECRNLAVVYKISVYSGNGCTYCNFSDRYRVYMPDCENQSLIDITDDYTEPSEPPELAYYDKTGYWEWSYSDEEGFFFCPCVGEYPLPSWPRDPVCHTCKCNDCGITVDWELEGQSFSTSIGTQNGPFSPLHYLCQDEPAGGEPSYRTVSAKAFCDPGGRVNLSIIYSWESPNYCISRKEYGYRFEECDSSGCPTGTALLVRTGLAGGNRFPPNFTCDSPEANKHCESNLDGPTNITVSLLP